MERQIDQLVATMKPTPIVAIQDRAEHTPTPVLVFLRVVSLSVDQNPVSRGKTLKIRCLVDSSKEVSDRIWIGASIPIGQGKNDIFNKSQDKRITLYEGRHEYDRDLTIPANAPTGSYKLYSNVWQGDKIIARGEPIEVVIV